MATHKYIFTPPGEVLARYYYDRSPVSVITGPLGCLSADTEYLTETGWKRMDEYRAGDRVAQWDSETGRVSFVLPDNYVVFPCDSMIHFRNKYSLSMVLSDEHRVPYYDYRRKFRVALAGEIEQHPSIRKIPITFTPPDGPGMCLDDDILRLAVSIHADGNFPVGCTNGFCRFGLRKERKKERLRKLLDACGVEYRERVYRSRPTETNFTFYSPYAGKHFDGLWWTCNSRQLEIVIDELSHWDGLFATDETRFFTSHKQDADFVQYAAHATGRKASMSRKGYDNANWRDTYTVYIHGANSRKNATNIRENTEITRVTPEDGKKYCFSVPTSFFLARHNDCIFVTGNSGKTTATCYKHLALMMEQKPNRRGIRPSRCIAVRNTYGELLSTTAKDFVTIFEDLGTFKQGGSEPPSFKMRFNLTDGTTVVHEMLFIALDRPQHVKKLRGHQVTWFWLSEMKELPKSIIDMADFRHGRYPSMQLGGVMPTYAGMIGDTNQCDEDHWLYEFQEELAPKGELPDWAFFVQPGGVIKRQGKWVLNEQAENLSNLPPGYYDKRIQGKSDDWINVNLANNYGFVMDGKPVHPEYSDHVHCVDDIDYIPDIPIVLGFDFGRTPACAILQEIDSTWYCLDEFVTKDMSAAKFGPALRNHLAKHYKDAAFIGWGDPAGAHPGEVVEHSAIETLQALGIPCEPCDTQDTLQRRAAVSGPLTELTVSGRPRLLICKKAKTIRKGLAGKFCYRRLQVAGDEKYMDVPDKNAWSHPVEALEYGLMGEGEGVAALIAADTSEYTERAPAPY